MLMIASTSRLVYGASTAFARRLAKRSQACHWICPALQRARLIGRAFSLALRSATLILDDKRAAIVLVTL